MKPLMMPILGSKIDQLSAFFDDIDPTPADKPILRLCVVGYCWAEAGC